MQAMHKREQLQESHNTNDGYEVGSCQEVLLRCSVFGGWNVRINC
jgi:hypothetical protein